MLGLWVLQFPLSIFADVNVFIRGFGISNVSVILEKSLLAAWVLALGRWVACVVICSIFTLRGVVVICIVGVIIMWKSSSAILAVGFGSGGGLLRVPV